MKIQKQCGCYCTFTQKVKFSKREYAYVICPSCGCCLGLNFKKGDKQVTPTSFSGYNVFELFDDFND